MLPLQYTTPAAGVLVAGGLVSCFFGYRFFRFVLALFGFLLGALIATSLTGTTNHVVLVAGALVGGLIGAALLGALGVGLLGAALAAIAINVAWRFVGTGEPPTLVIVIACVLGALGALSIVKYILVFGTALIGSWTLIVGAWALLGDRAQLRAASAADIWAVYPLDLVPSRWWVMPMWLAIALAGVLVQLAMGKPKPKARAAAAVKK